MNPPPKDWKPIWLRARGHAHRAIIRKRHLPRLDPHFYQGYAAVFWTFTLEDRTTGWLTEPFHQRFRELMLHAAARHPVMCPAYCLMPDHLHFVWLGLRRETDQRLAVRQLRRDLGPWLAPHRFQHQPHDHVLRGDDRRRGEFQRHCDYVLFNPVRRGLVKRCEDWPWTGCLAPGYADLELWADDYWKRFWRIYTRQREIEPPPSGPVPLLPPGAANRLPGC